ncbi:MAG: hypothetical protein ABUS54_05215 [Actinomycetota bacterium]
MRSALAVVFFALVLAPVSSAAAPRWPNHSSTLGNRVDALGLHALPSEGAAEHIHAHLDVYVDGQRVTVPALVGIDVPDQFITELHTHDTTGIIHIESPDVRPFTLGQFFGEWNEPLSAKRLGSVSGAVHWWVNGKARTGDPAKLVLKAHAEIALAVGALPKRVPASYRFPFGY